MISRFFFAGLLWSILLITPTLTPAQLENLVPNPGFEEGEETPTGWELELPDPNPNGINWVFDIGRTSPTERGIRCNNPSPFGVFSGTATAGLQAANIPVTPGKSYTFAYWSKMDNATRVFCQIFWNEASGAFIQGEFLNNIIVEFNGSSGLNHDWQEQRKEDILVPETADGKPVAGLSILIHPQGGGTYRFDDVQLLEQKEPLFPDLTADGRLDHQDQLSMGIVFSPTGVQSGDVGFDEVYEMIDSSRSRTSFIRGIPFRAYYPLVDGAFYHYVSIDPGNNTDYFDKVVSGPMNVLVGSEVYSAYKVSTINSSDPEGEQSALFTATGPLSIIQIIIDTEINTEGITIPEQTIDLSTPLVVGLEHLTEGFEQTTAATGNVIAILPGIPTPVTVPAAIELTSRVLAFGRSVILRDDAATEVSKTVTMQTDVLISGEYLGTPIAIYYQPGAGIGIFQRGIGMVQLQEFTDPHTAGEIFPLRSATIGSATFP